MGIMKAYVKVQKDIKNSQWVPQLEFLPEIPDRLLH